MAASYRLARYNLLADTDEKKDFLGMPVPLAAFGLVSYIIFCYHIWGQLRYDEWLVSMIIGFAFLMVSQVQYDTLPEHFGTRWERIKLVALIVGAVAVLIQPRLLLFPFIGLYILFGLVREVYRLLNRGVVKVTGRSNGRPTTDRRNNSNGK